MRGAHFERVDSHERDGESGNGWVVTVTPAALRATVPAVSFTMPGTAGATGRDRVRGRRRQLQVAQDPRDVRASSMIGSSVPAASPTTGGTA